MHKHSRQRDGILELLSVANYHPTVNDLFNILKTSFPNISLATVYRNLEYLNRAGRVVRIDVPNKPAHYDGNIKEHYHIRCLVCGDIKDVWINYDLIDENRLEAIISDYELKGYDICFVGICRKCSSEDKKQN